MRCVVVVARVVNAQFVVSSGLAIVELREITKRNSAPVTTDPVIAQPIERLFERFAL